MMSALMLISMASLLMAMFMLLNSTFISIEMPFLLITNSTLKISIILDWLSTMFMSTVTLISGMILLFSMQYIPNKEHKQFSTILLAFVMSMIILILSDNIIFILLGWDGLGLSSYILVIFYQNASSSASGSITVFSNRVGDIMILLSISLMAMTMNWNFSMNEEYPMLILLFLLIAALSKSAQFPFSAWLPAAMAAPTPISALVHSSTLVTAGVFLLIRIMNFSHPKCMLLLLLIATMTALYASMSANWEKDLKKIIALSTLSQIAMMMFAISIGSPSLAFFHLIIHALFKSMMFLCAGIIIHNSSYQDARHMPSMMKNSPLPPAVLGVASMALMGLPFMSGFFSKDAIMEMMMTSNFSLALSMIMISSIGMTASYSSRLLKMAIMMNMKTKPDLTTRPSNFMELPIFFMAPLSVFLGAMMTWITSPEQMFILPLWLKLSIIMALTMGFMLGALLSLKSNLFTKMGNSALSMWFTHFLTTSLFLISSPQMKKFLYLDKSWQEMYGPKKTFSELKILSSAPQTTTFSTMFLMMMMTILPPSLLILMY